MSGLFAEVLSAPRILIEAKLAPLQGSRFQPTGFPSLGAAEFTGPDGTAMLLVESPQSMANRLEATIWDDAREDLIAVLDGLPFVSTVVDGRGTDSIREAHRLNSPYLIDGIKVRLQERAGISGKKAKGKSADDEDADESSGIDIRKLARAVFYYDPNSVLHGVFLEKIVGAARLTRVLSAFIEARGVRAVESGGVKNDRIDPKGRAKGGAAKGFGNVPFSRTEYCADEITAYFSIDIALLKAYGLGDRAEDLLVALALLKIGRFLESSARLRSACDFDVEKIIVSRPSGWELPRAADLESELRGFIAACHTDGLFADPAKTVV